MKSVGFEERFLRILGAQVGLPLTKAEQIEKQRACMPCHQRMAERFGPAS
jgi:cytochrome c551/c552